MGVVVADVPAHRSELSPSSDPHPSQPEWDPTPGLARGMEDEGPEDSLLALTDPPSEASAQDPPVGTDDSYEVTWTVDIAMAFPRGEEEARWDGRGTRAGGVPEPPRVQSYYHLEYHLLPQHSEPVKVDLAMFGPVVKIYRNSESKALRPWCEGDQAWVSWSHSFSVSVTRELLQELLSHRILFRLWEGKDKVCSKARYDRPRAFRPPPACPEEGARVCGGIMTMVSRLRELTQKDNSKMSKKKRNTTVEIQRPSNEETQKDVTAAFTSAQQSEATAADLESMKRNGIAWAESSPLCLLAGATSLAESFSVVCPSAVREALFSVSLDRTLMSEQLKAQLNPLVITIVSANSMPSTPVPLHLLQEKCLPVYCQYQFLKSKTHKTKPQRHGTRVYFGDVFVVLAGAMGRGELREYLTGPPLEIQVHDRDRKPEKLPGTPGLFGTRPDDDKLSSVAFVGRKRSVHGPAAAQAYETYAVAHLDLSELLLGRRSLKVNLPIRSCPPPQLLGRERPMWERKMMDLPGVADGHVSKPMEQGHYFDSDAHLKVKVEIAHPLLGGPDPVVGSCDCLLFGRIVFIFGSNNVHVRTKLRSEILKINTAAFNIGSCPSEFLDRVLTDYLLSPEERESKDLDFVTGFHVQDEKMHLVVVEGLRHKAVRSLWETVPQRLGGCAEEQVKVLYSSGLGFSERVYGSLDVNLSPVRLHRPLEDIMRNPLVYVRAMLPHSCFQALSRPVMRHKEVSGLNWLALLNGGKHQAFFRRLSQLCHARQLLEALRRDLFPTEDMILSVSRELGTLPGKTEKKPQVEEEEEEKEEVPAEPVAASSLAVRERRREPLDMHNTEYIQWKRLPAQQQGRHTKDYVKENIRELQLRSLPVQKPRLAVWGPAVLGPVHNYSIQTFNSHRQGLERLRKEMAKVPGRRFTYSQQYQSATVEPGRVTLAPRTAGPAFDCHLPRDDHPPRPDQSRVDELSKPWRENVLHANTLKPPLTRDRWPWARRSLDFQLYITPPHLFGPPRSMCMHLAGEGLHQEQLAVGRRTPGVWSAGGPVPDDHGQLPDFKCYLGAGSGKFQEILKDEPRKYSLRKPGLALKPLPALAVLTGGPEESQNKALAPGPYPEKNFTAINNTIPRRPSLYKEYRFKRYCTPRSLLHKRRCSPLTAPERARHAARGPRGKTRPQNTATARPFKNLVEVRTHREVTLYAQ